MKALCIDFETEDLGLLTYGSGWAFKYNFPEYDFNILGCGLMSLIDGKEEYIQFKYPNSDDDLANKLLLELINKHDALICHNAMYDLGCLTVLFRDSLDLAKFTIFDTVILAKIHDQHLDDITGNRQKAYSLDTLTKHYNLDEVKQTNVLTDAVWLSGLFQKEYLKDKNINKKTRPSEEVLSLYAYRNLRHLPVDIVKEYCLQDVRATVKLFNYLKDKLCWATEDVFQRYSKLCLLCLDCKKRGVRIDLKKVKELIKYFDNEKRQIITKLAEKLGKNKDININSPKQLGELLTSFGHEVPTTDKGNYSVTKIYLETLNSEVSELILRHRKVSKFSNDFAGKLLKYQTTIPEKYRDENKGWLFPTLKILGAHKTGRFSSGGGLGCLELSIHQIPRRDEEFGHIMRSLFIPHEGDKLICADFNGQESRLQVHYGEILGCSGTKEIINKWTLDPNMKYYHIVQEITGLNYDDAKMITLGLSYGMGVGKMIGRLGLAYEKGKKIIDQYYRMLPFMKQLQEITSKNITRLQYIKTIGGRRLYIDPPYFDGKKYFTKEYKALSKLIQGSGADQCQEAMVKAWEKGLNILFSVHDEILVSSSNPDKDSKTLIECMEHAYELTVPVIADCNYGNSWEEAK